MSRGRKPKAIEPVECNHSEGAMPKVVDFKTEKWTVSTITYRTSKDLIRLDVELQRGFVWNAKQRSLFIHTILCGYPVPQLVAIKDGKNYDLLDGKQRITTINMFCNDKFALRDIPLIKYDDDTEDDYNGLKFSELPEDTQKAIESYNLNFMIFAEGTTKKEAEDIFYRFNNGTSLKSSDKNFSKAINREQIIPLLSHDIFDKALTDTAKEKLSQRQIVINSYIMLFTDDYSLDSGDVSKFLREYDISDEDKDALTSIFDRLLFISNQIEQSTDPGTLERRSSKRLLSRTNIPILVKFLSTHEDDDKNAEFLQYFFSGNSKSSINQVYNDASQSGSGHLDNIQKKLKALNDDYDNFE